MKAILLLLFTTTVSAKSTCNIYDINSISDKELGDKILSELKTVRESSAKCKGIALPSLEGLENLSSKTEMNCTNYLDKLQLKTNSHSKTYHLGINHTDFYKCKENPYCTANAYGEQVNKWAKKCKKSESTGSSTFHLNNFAKEVGGILSKADINCFKGKVTSHRFVESVENLLLRTQPRNADLKIMRDTKLITGLIQVKKVIRGSYIPNSSLSSYLNCNRRDVNRAIVNCEGGNKYGSHYTNKEKICDENSSYYNDAISKYKTMEDDSSSIAFLGKLDLKRKISKTKRGKKLISEAFSSSPNLSRIKKMSTKENIVDSIDMLLSMKKEGLISDAEMDQHIKKMADILYMSKKMKNSDASANKALSRYFKNILVKEAGELNRAGEKSKILTSACSNRTIVQGNFNKGRFDLAVTNKITDLSLYCGERVCSTSKGCEHIKGESCSKKQSVKKLCFAKSTCESDEDKPSDTFNKLLTSVGYKGKATIDYKNPLRADEISLYTKAFMKCGEDHMREQKNGFRGLDR